ncbi:hypothetical protein Srubr_15880 [Streptomyces rubradiris]|uniref:DUF2752 domain-containing protein n=1 Tax=Streptomyces rubradiris TaxID=285531 RepID=A0ABQ3R7C0_STRRR|nr:hypothetical protein GCM10018792_46920 [Streptomyces rubradiris]GHI51742.1 hypothetical protein Srubr_15880 [Streptomyces rubradiris]
MNADSRTAPPEVPGGAPHHPVPPGAQRPAPPAVPVRRRLAVPLGLFAAVAGAFAYVGAVDPNESGHYPACPLYLLTGLYCPGCGGLRSAHAFVHGDLLAALHANAPAVAAYLGFAVLWTVWTARAARGRPLRLGLGPVQLWTVVALLLAFTVLRNLPFGGWLRP